jgi:hypothetical protein
MAYDVMMLGDMLSPYCEAEGAVLQRCRESNSCRGTTTTEDVVTYIWPFRVTTAHVCQPSRVGIGELSKIKREEGILYLLANLYELLPNYSS